MLSGGLYLYVLGDLGGKNKRVRKTCAEYTIVGATSKFHVLLVLQRGNLICENEENLILGPQIWESLPKKKQRTKEKTQKDLFNSKT